MVGPASTVGAALGAAEGVSWWLAAIPALLGAYLPTSMLRTKLTLHDDRVVVRRTFSTVVVPIVEVAGVSSNQGGIYIDLDGDQFVAVPAIGGDFIVRSSTSRVIEAAVRAQRDAYLRHA